MRRKCEWCGLYSVQRPKVFCSLCDEWRDQLQAIIRRKG